MDRRTALRVVVCSMVAAACRSATGPDPARGELRARPRTPAGALPAGYQALGLSATRDAMAYLPAGAPPADGWPLLVLLHGAGGSADYFAPFFPIAEENRLVLLLPQSRAGSWSTGDFAPDVEHIDRSLLRLFAHVPVADDRIAVAGFSAGGTYALTVGLANGGLFREVTAFAPAALELLARRGRPRVHLVHGSADTAVPLARSRDEILPRLRALGYAIDLTVFDGDHTVPVGQMGLAMTRAVAIA